MVVYKTYIECIDKECKKETKEIMNKNNINFLIEIYFKIDKIKNIKDFNKVFDFFKKDERNNYQFNYIKCSLYKCKKSFIEFITRNINDTKEIPFDIKKEISDVKINTNKDDIIMKLTFILIYIIRININNHLKNN